MAPKVPRYSLRKEEVLRFDKGIKLIAIFCLIHCLNLSANDPVGDSLADCLRGAGDALLKFGSDTKNEEFKREVAENLNVAVGKMAAIAAKKYRHIDEDDLVQHTVIGLMEDAPRIFEDFDPERGSIQGYLYRAVQQKFNEILRKEARAQRTGAKGRGTATFEGTDFPIASNEAGPAETVIDEESKAVADVLYQKIMRRAEEVLTKKQLAVFKLRVPGEMPYREISKKLGTTEGTAKVLLARAMQKLKKEFKGDPLGSLD